MKIQGKNILITGGGSGIGKLMGKEALLQGVKTFNVNTLAPMYVTRVVLPDMLKKQLLL